ncbi:hypothetical protein ACFLQN_00025 [Candidatus Aenigmatarchaeota archaeon]
MKGQHRIIREIFLFAIGVAITSFIVLSFNNVQYATNKLAMNDQMTSVSNLVTSGIIKATESEESIIRIEIPEKMSGETYIINIDGNDGEIIVSLFDDPSINLTKKIFNINQDYFMTGNVISTARFFEITREGNNIKIKRSVI